MLIIDEAPMTAAQLDVLHKRLRHLEIPEEIRRRLHWHYHVSEGVFDEQRLEVPKTPTSPSGPASTEARS